MSKQTAKEWIASVKDPVIKRYLEKNVSPIVLTETLIESFNAFLYGSFYFGKSKQGELFWHAIGDAVEESDPSTISYSDFKHLDKSVEQPKVSVNEDHRCTNYDPFGNCNCTQKVSVNEDAVDFAEWVTFNCKMERNIYKIGKELFITSDEEIKEGNYVVVDCSEIEIEEVRLVIGYYNEQFLFDDRGQIHMDYCKKVILTTDQDLIKDGVQAIDDEFLEWFVKNPSCEEVEVEKKSYIEIKEISYEGDFQNVEYVNYKIIIPQEEPKQDYSGVHIRHCYQGEYEDSCKYGEDDCPAKPLKPKQETLEEAAENYVIDESFLPVYKEECERAFINGAKWQAERMYSEEDLKSAFFNGGDMKDIEEFNHWFEQFKKK